MLLLHYVTETKIKVSQWFYHSEDIVIDSSGRIWTKPDDMTDVDWLIVRLNNQGLGQVSISKALKARKPSIRLASINVRKHLTKIEQRFPGITRVVAPWGRSLAYRRTVRDLDHLVTQVLGGKLDADDAINQVFGPVQDEKGRSVGYRRTVFHGLTELDSTILALNNQGLTTGQIQKALPMYRMKLGKTQIWHHLVEIRHTNPGRYVRANSKLIGGKPREQGKWYNIVLKVKDAIPEYVRLLGFKPSVRSLQYDFIDNGIIKDTETEQFQRAVTHARVGYKGTDGKTLLPKLDIDCFAADDSRILAGDYQDFEPQETKQPGEIPDSVKTVDELITQLKKAPADYDGKAPEGTKGKRGGRWYGQPEYVEVWMEKNDLIEAFEKILEDKHIRIRGNHGFASFDWLRQCAEALNHVMDSKGLEPENVHIIYCGDWDPSGELMDNYMGRRLRLEEFGLPGGIDFERIAITSEQIEQYHFPLLNIEQKPDKKRPNPNLHEYKRRFGDKATHLNAFFTRAHLEEFKRILLAKVDELWYQEIYDVMVETYEVEPNKPKSLPEEELKQRRIEMYRKITKAFASGWYRGLPWAPDYW